MNKEIPPTTIDIYGKKYWRNKNGDLHREDGPAFEGGLAYRRGWYINGVCHRLDGPAREYSDGQRFWYFNGKHIPVNSQKEFEQYLRFLAFV